MSHLDESTLTALLDHELEPAAAQAAQDHLTFCPECRALYQEIQGLATEADRLIGTMDLPANTAAPAPVRSGYRWSRWRPFAWAASVLLALGLGWTSSTFRARPSAAVAPTAAADAEARGAESTGVTDRAVVIAPTPPQAGAPNAAPPAEPTRTLAADKVSRTEQARVAAPIPQANDGVNQPTARDQPGTAKTAANAVALAAAERQDAAAPAAPPTPAAQGDVTLESAAPAWAAAPASTLQRRGGRAAGEPGKDEVSANFKEITLEEAVRQLGGSVRLLEGMVPVRVLSGADGLDDRDTTGGIVRVVYLDPPGRELWLDQLVSTPIEEKAAAAHRLFMNPLLPGDTLAQVDTGDARSIRWIDDTGRPLRLTGYLSADSLRVLMTRVR